MKTHILLLIAATAFSAVCSADPITIYTGSENGDYNSVLAPALFPILKSKPLFALNVKTQTTDGTLDNVNKVLKDLTAIGLGQGDAYAYARSTNPDVDKNLEVIRSKDTGYECLIAVVSKELYDQGFVSWDVYTKNSVRYRMVTGAETSGGAATLKLILPLEPESKNARVTYMPKGASQAVDAVIKHEAHIAFFVQMPNPESAIFKQINDAGLAYIPVLSRKIYQLKSADGQPVYEPQSHVLRRRMFGIANDKPVETMCTQMVYFTGKPSLMNGTEAADQQAMIDAIKNAKQEQIIPQKNGWLDVIRKKAVVGNIVDLVDQGEAAARSFRN